MSQVGGQDFDGGFPRAVSLSEGTWLPLLAPDLPNVDLLDVSATTVDNVLAVGTEGTILRRIPGEPSRSGKILHRCGSDW